MNRKNEEGHSPEGFPLQFEIAYSDHGRKLRYYAMKFLNNAHDAEDIVATLFAHLWSKGPEFNRDKLNWNYLKKAVRNACLDHLNEKGRFERMRNEEQESPLSSSIPSHEEDVIRTEVVAQISDLIDRLPPQTRRIIRKLYYEDMEPGEAADDMRLALSTIYNSRRSGFEVLMDLLRRKNIRLWLCATLVYLGNYRN
jgi:RNA polymerase sigma-70 factor (ECF subfamily)